MIVDVCDPAKAGKDRGFAVYSSAPLFRTPGGIVAWGSQPIRDVDEGRELPDWGVVEAQWANPKASRQSLITLAARAGFCFTLVPAKRYAMIPPTTIRVGKKKLPGWKDILIPGFGNAEGDVFSRSIADLLRRMKHPAAAEQNHNVLDAIGLALAVGRILEGHAAARGVTLEMYEIT